MKLPLMAFAAAIAFGQSSNRVVVSNANLTEKSDAIEVEVVHSGGCLRHTFALEIVTCRETSPVSCDLHVKDTTPETDNCRALVHEKISFPLKNTILKDAYYKRALLNLRGDNESRATVRLL